jgi:hypothetical protein
MMGHASVRRFSRWPWVGSLGLAALAGCAPADPLEVACGGAQPALEDCGSLGVYSADCGGEGSSVFACTPELGTCRWFAGGCVAEGYVASDCPSSDPCCHATADGPWPFADGMTEALGAPHEMAEEIAVIGGTPIDDSGPFNLTVTVDPTFSYPERPVVTCEGEMVRSTFGQLCQGYLLVIVAQRTHESVALELSPSLYGATIALELWPSDAGAVGRAFVAYQNDFRTTPVARCNEGIAGLGLAPNGTLTVTGLEEMTLHGEVVIPFDDGSITVAF